MRKLISWLLIIGLSCGICFANAEQVTEEDISVLFDEKPSGTGTVYPLDEAGQIMDKNEAKESKPFVPGPVYQATGSKSINVNRKEYPYSAIAYIETHHECGCNKSGTAFLIGRNLLATAAHCLVCVDHGKWADRMTMYFGYKSSRNYLKKYNDKWTAYVGNTFQNRKYSMDGDYGVIKINKNLGDELGWFGVTYASDGDVECSYWMTAGYRHDDFRYSSGWAEVYDPDHMMLSTIDFAPMLPGHGGSPLYNNGYYVGGILICSDSSYNYAYRMTNLYNIINKYK